jgi:hypothetical protein
MTDPQERIERAAAEAGLSQEQIVQSDIEQARAELADTVDALAAKLDVKAQAGQRVAEAKQKAADAATRAKQAAPPAVQHALDTAGEKAAPIVQKVSQQAAPHRGKIIAVGAVVLLVLIVVRRRGNPG